MINIKKLIVSIHLGAEELELGELIAEGKKIYFKYYASFIKQGLEISPFKLKLSQELYSANEQPFEGLYGVFSDSLPDGWGRLLLDRTFASKGISLYDITPLDRLAHVGTKGMGALIYRPAIDDISIETHQIELDLIATATEKILAGTSTDIIEELYSLGGSSGGARPKILIGYNPATNHLIHGTDNLPSGYEHWIIKFPSSSDRPDIANIEFAYYKMAVSAGIEMSESKLFEGKSGQVYFGTKRFDRNYNQRYHLHSASGLMHDNFRLSNLDYGNIMDCAFRLEKHVEAYEKVLRLAAFNVFAHNRDDHSKNFSFLMNATGKWEFAPAYDLTFSNSGHGMHSTMVAGESKNPGTKHLLELATYFNIKKPNAILEKVRDTVTGWQSFANESGVSKESLKLVHKVITAKS